MNLSVVILAKNEELNIVDCIEAVSFADEVVVIDDNSTDRTVELAEMAGARVVKHSLNNNFASQRNFALNVVHGKWVLFVDADERVSKLLASEIKSKILEDNDVVGYLIQREDEMAGVVLRYGEVSNLRLLRLAKRTAGKWKGKVHEKWRVVGVKEQLKNSIRHIPHPTIYSFVEEIDRYTTLRTQELSEEGNRTNGFLIILYPAAKFIANYFIKRGYKDGVNGFVLAMMMSFHSFLVRAKLYLLQK